MGPKQTTPLVAAIRRGDEEAFTQFYRDWFDRSVATVRQLTRRDEAFCLDVVQDVMLKVVHRLPPLGSQLAFEAWMARTMFTTSMDRLRSDRRRHDRERTAASANPEAVSHEGAAAASHREHVDWLTARLAELPPADRAMLLSRYRDSETLRDVGARLGISQFAVHGRIRRILARIARSPTAPLDHPIANSSHPKAHP